jgi:ribosome maturation factor RimP
MRIAEQVGALVEPLLENRGLELVDVEHGGGFLRVIVDRDGGVDLDSLSELTRQVSGVLDEADPVPGGYTLEVSSPGLERPLRTPTHFRRAIGTKVAVRTMAGTEGARRVTGTLTDADEHGITIEPDGDGEQRRLEYGDIERARTVFEWGPAPRPTPKRTKKKAPSS